MAERWRSLAAAVLAALLVFAGIVLWLWRSLPDVDTVPVEFLPAQFSAVMGSAQEVEGRLRIEGYANGFALLSSGPVEIDAAELRILRYELETGTAPADPELIPAFFWRRGEDPANLSRLALNGPAVLDLGGRADWSGRIVEIGFLFPQIEDAAPELGPVSLSSAGLGNAWSVLWAAWKQPEPWSQRSINFLFGGAPGQAVPLTLAAALWVLVTLILLRVARGRGAPYPAGAAIIVFLLAWMLLDVRWTANRAMQFQAAVTGRWTLSDPERMALRMDGRLYQSIRRYREKVLDRGAFRILIVGDEDRFGYHLLRAKYHLLPDSAVVRRNLPARLDPGRFDYVLFVDEFGAMRASWNDIWQQLPMTDSWRTRLSLVDSGEMSILFEVTDE